MSAKHHREPPRGADVLRAVPVITGYQAQRPQLFQSPESMRWFLRNHRDELLQAGAAEDLGPLDGRARAVRRRRRRRGPARGAGRPMSASTFVATLQQATAADASGRAFVSVLRQVRAGLAVLSPEDRERLVDELVAPIREHHAFSADTIARYLKAVAQ
jgi:hypothetical protein